MAERPTMTTIVLAHPAEQRARFQVFAVYDSRHEHSVFAALEFADRMEAELVARKMMEEFEADHFRRVVAVGERIG
jgi:L-amino acid N-acyltransferase YncA